MGCYIPTLSQSPEVPLLYSIPGHFAHFVVTYYTATGFTVCRYKFYGAMNGQQLTIKIIIGKHVNQCIDLLDDLSTFCGNSRAEWNVTIRRPSFSVYNKLSSTRPQLSVIHTIIIILSLQPIAVVQLCTGLMIMASHRTFSGLTKHMFGQIKSNLARQIYYILSDGEVIKCAKDN